MSARDDTGLTLVELLVSIAVLLVIMTPLMTSFVLTVTTTATSDQEVTNSADAQILATYFDADVNNADTVRVSSTCGGTASILELQWLDGATRHYVSYQAEPVAAALQATLAEPAYVITRYECTSPAGPAASTQQLVRTTAGATTPPGPPIALCDGSPCSDTSPTPRTVALSIRDLGKATGRDFSFTLSATRKVA